MTVRKEITSSIAVILFGFVFLLYSRRYPLDTWACPGPGAFPLVVGSLLLLLSFLQLGQSLWKWKRSGKREAPPDRAGSIPKFFEENPGEKSVLRLVVVFVLYILGMRWVGYFVSTFVFALLVSRITEGGGWRGPVLLSAGINLFCYLLFVVWLKLSFPNGLLF